MSALPGMLDAPDRADFESRIRVRVLAHAYAIGATFGLLTLVLPHGAGGDTAGQVTCALAALALGVLLEWRGSRLPDWALPLIVACGSALVTLGAWSSAQMPSPLICFYLWCLLYAAYFLSPRMALMQAAWVGTLYAGLLAARPPAGGALDWWLVGMASLGIAAGVVRTMRDTSSC